MILLFLFPAICRCQKIDAVYFNLYTDSLKKGTHNYININGQLSNGRFIPLNNKQIIFWCNTGYWEGNDLIIDTGYKDDSVIIKATLIEKPDLNRSIVVYIKRSSDEGKLAREKNLINIKPKKKN